MDETLEQILDKTVGYKTRIILRSDALEAMKIAMKQAFIAGCSEFISNIEDKRVFDSLERKADEYLNKLEEKK